MNQRKIGLFLNYINIVIHTFINLMYVPVLIYYIGKNEYGLYQLICSFIAYFSIMDFGLSATIVRFYVKYKTLNNIKAIENILAIAMWCYFVITLLITSMGVLCYFNLDIIFSNTMSIIEIISAKKLFILLLINIVVVISTMIFKAIINAHEKFLLLKSLDLLQLVLQPFFIILILQKYPYAFSVALVQTVLNIIMSFIRIYYCINNLHVRIKFYYWDKTLFKDFKKLALSVFFVSLVDQIFFKTNQIILGIISGTTAVAMYSIALVIYTAYMSLSTNITGIYLPYVTNLITQKKSINILSNLFIDMGKWQYYLLTLILTSFFIFGKQFILLWTGYGFEEVYWIVLIIIIPLTIELIQNIGSAILQAQNRYNFRAKVYFAMGIFNLCLAIPLGLRYGGMGCAFATGLSMFIGNGLIMNYYYLKVTKLDIKSFWQQIGKITIGIIPITLIGYLININLMNDSILFFAFKIFIYIIIYNILIYKLFMNFDERNKIKSIIYKITRQNI